MNIIQKIATQIVARIETQAADQKGMTGKVMGQKVKDAMNLEQWCGAVAALVALQGEKGEEAQWANRVLVMVIWARGYSETQRIAQEGKDADRFAEVEAEKEAQIDKMFAKA